jgi:hypothetical protein
MRPLAQQSFPKSRRNSGIGYIMLPTDLDRDEYIKTCYRTGTVSIIGEEGFDVAHRVRIGKIAIQLIEFPNSSNELGSGVFWVKLANQEEPIITEVLFNQAEGLDNEEGDFTVSKGDIDSNSSFLLTKDGKYLISVSSNKEGVAVVDIKAVSENETGLINIFSNGILNISSTKETNVKSNGTVRVQGTNEDETELSEIVVENGKVTVLSEEIIHNEGNEPMVLGDTLAEKIDKILDILLNAKTATSIGLQPLDPKSLTDLQSLKTQLDEFKSKKSKLD